MYFGAVRGARWRGAVFRDTRLTEAAESGVTTPDLLA